MSTEKNSEYIVGEYYLDQGAHFNTFAGKNEAKKYLTEIYKKGKGPETNEEAALVVALVRDNTIDMLRLYTEVDIKKVAEANLDRKLELGSILSRIERLEFQGLSCSPIKTKEGCHHM